MHHEYKVTYLKWVFQATMDSCGLFDPLSRKSCSCSTLLFSIYLHFLFPAFEASASAVLCISVICVFIDFNMLLIWYLSPISPLSSWYSAWFNFGMSNGYLVGPPHMPNDSWPTVSYSLSSIATNKASGQADWYSDKSRCYGPGIIKSLTGSIVDP